MKVFGIIYLNFVALGYLLTSKISTGRKLRILATFLRITLKYLTISKLITIKKERIFGFTVRAFSYQAIYYLFREIFVRTEYYFKPATSEPMIFDCGANLGMATLYWKWLYPDARIQAFEPDPQSFQLLQENVAANNLTHVTLHHVALAAKEELTSLSVDPERPGMFRMSTTIGRIDKAKITVQAKPLSAFINQRIDLLKMDIEGAEMSVIEEIEPLLNQVGEMIIEYHHNIDGHPSEFASFTGLLERNKFNYQLDARCIPFYSRNRFQDVLIYCYPSSQP
jgi:FkbM family methyltransferase